MQNFYLQQSISTLWYFYLLEKQWSKADGQVLSKSSNATVTTSKSPAFKI